MSSDEQLDLEFAYTSHRDSCQDPHSPFYYCRRPAGHSGAHAAGYGSLRIRWDDESDEPAVLGPPAGNG